MASADDKSFVTVLIIAHGRELKHIRATPEQNRTLRRLAMAGKSGMLSLQGIPNMMPSIFYNAHVLSKNPHIPFTEKLRRLSSHLCELGFNEQLQKRYEEWPMPVICKAPTKHDWFSTSQVKYDHFYSFYVNDESDPWERDVLGIWLLDGSKDVLKSEDFKPTKEKNNIMRQLGLPYVWPLTHDKNPTENHTFSTTMFDLETRLKNRYMVKHVNFIDLTCRYNPKTLLQRASSWFVNSSDDDEIEDVPDEPLEEVDVGGIAMQILKIQPRGLPSNWKYVKIPRNGVYVYVNLETGKISPEFPKYEMSLRPIKLNIDGLKIKRLRHPSIKGTIPTELPPGWSYWEVPSSGNRRLYIHPTSGVTNPVVPKSPSSHGGKVKKSRKRKCLRSRTESRKKRSS
jgi:hypothetical protein